MILKINDIKKNLKRGDLKKVAKEHKFKYSLVAAVSSGLRKNNKVLSALISQAEKNKQEDEALISRTKKL